MTVQHEQALKLATNFIGNAKGEKKPPYTDSTLSFGQAMVAILQTLQTDTQTMVAAMLYPEYFYNQIKSDTIRENFGNHIASLLKGAKQFESIHNIRGNHTSYNQKQIDNLRKMLLAIVSDVRVVLIKLAECLANLQFLRKGAPIQQQQYAMLARDIYAPLANRLGVGQIKWQLEDFAFRYLNNAKYLEISKALNMRRQDREHFIQQMKAKLTLLFNQANIHNVEISGRAKHIYSIYKKCQRKQVNVKDIYDSSALRVLVPTVKDCYTALSLVHAEWEPIAKEFDDYISKPKPNGYQSIHTAVIGPKNINVEIQIRTYQMHEEAELGVAAHWKYKENQTEQSTYEEKIKWLRQVMDWQQEINNDNIDTDNTIQQAFNDRVYVFTPTGDVYDLKAGATPLDFAYLIHTEIGHRCKGAKVNDKLVPLTQQLKTGDRVSILTHKAGSPSRDWLNSHSGYLATEHARAKVRAFFRKKEHEKNLTLGIDIWEKGSRNTPYSKNDLNKITSVFNFKKIDDLLAALGNGDISFANILHKLHHLEQTEAPKSAEKEIFIKSKETTTESSANFNIAGVGNLVTQLARCCKPIPGDAIIGYITKDRGISIHQQRCRNIQHAIAYRPERIVEVNWQQQKQQQFPVDIIIQASDRQGLLRDISNILADEKMMILGLNSHTNKLENRAYLNVTIQTSSLEPLNKVINKINQIDGVMEVRRK